MPFSLEEISQQPVVIVLYNSGASGEFLAYALSQTISQFKKPKSIWENQTRCKFDDYFGRSFTSGAVTNDLILERVNLYWKKYLKSRGEWHLGLVHNEYEYLNILQNLGPDWPVIEITTISPQSQKFQYEARISKISQKFRPPQTYCQKVYAKKHLQIEWSDLILTDTKNSYSKIINFLEGHGNIDRFEYLVNDYRTRNENLLKTLYES